MPKLRQPQAKPEDEIVKVDPNQQELELADGGEPEIEIVDDAEGQDDAALALQQQIDSLKKSEKIQRERADKAESDRREALSKAQERETQIARFQKEAKESQFDAISSALAAANAEAEKAQQDIENAIANGDARLQAEAYRRLARAETNILRLEDGKTEIEAQAKAEPKRETQVQQSDDPLERTNLPDTAKNWLRAHPEYLTDNRKNAKIQALHWDVVDEGLAPFSTEYFESLEKHLGLRQAEQAERAQPQPAQRTNIVSAPVSREVPTGGSNRSNTKITLTAMQKEAAKMAGISETEYAKQLIKLNDLKSNGQYTGGGN